MFAGKLNILMTITGVSNVQLANSIHFDPSYISKLRHGKRKLPKQGDFLKKVSVFLARHITSKQQKHTLESLLQCQYPKDPAKAAELILNWLSEGTHTHDLITDFLDRFSMPLPSSEPTNSNVYASLTTKKEETEKQLFYIGVEGKRQAVIRFFQDILRSDKIYRLKLFSEEHSGWLLDDPEFLKTWGNLFKQVLMKGNRVTIVHQVTRDLSELIASVSQWLPLYVSGTITPYFCPRKRDGIINKTIFLAPQLAAVISDSVALNTEGMLNTFINEKNALEAVEKEYDEYLKICRPLMEIISADHVPAYLNIIDKLKSKLPSQVYYQSRLPDIATIPEELLKKKEKEQGLSLRFIYNRFRNELEDFLQENQMHTLLQMPDTLLQGKDLLIPQSVFTGTKLYYADHEELKMHYREVLNFLKKYDNYHVYLCDSITPYLNTLAAVDAGAVIERLTFPYTIFGMEEQNTTTAFFNHLEEQARFAKLKDRKKVIEYLEKITE